MTRSDTIVGLVVAGMGAALAAAGYPRPALAGLVTCVALLVCGARKAALVAAVLAAAALVVATSPTPPKRDRPQVQEVGRR